MAQCAGASPHRGPPGRPLFFGLLRKEAGAEGQAMVDVYRKL
jgi:hypothetical protein